MKKSNVVFTSVLTGGVLMAVLHHDATYRDVYADREDCQQDWGTYASECSPESSSTGYSSHYSGSSSTTSRLPRRYTGPVYEEGARPYTVRQHLVQSRQLVSRSGFGSSGARFSGGG